MSPQPFTKTHATASARPAPCILALTGCPQIRSHSSALIRHTINAIKTRGIPVVETGLYDLYAEDLFYGNAYSGSFIKLQARIRSAKAIIIVTPICNGSFSSGLKSLLARCEENAFAGKVLVPLMAAEHAQDFIDAGDCLSPVLHALGAASITPSVQATEHEAGWNDNGCTFVDTAVRRKIADALSRMYEFCRESEVPTSPKTLAELYRLAGYGF